MGFTINLAKGFKKKPKASKPDIVSKLCIGITVKEGNYVFIVYNNSSVKDDIEISITLL